MMFQRSRFHLCVLLLLITLCIQMFLWLAFMNLPVYYTSNECECPTIGTPSLDDSTCGPPPSEQQMNITKRDAVDPTSRDHLQESSTSRLEEETAKGTHYLLVVIVLSSVKGRERRDAIRKTWMKGYQKDQAVVVTFAVGTLGLSPSSYDELKDEDNIHNDLLLLSGLEESYSNLTRKVLYSFVWVDQHLRFDYLMKCDDDTFVVLDTILDELSQRISHEGFYWGFFDGRASVKKQGKWAERDWFLCDRYLPYALGGGYVISSDLIHRIAMNADGLLLYNSEDVSVGVWLSAYKAERKHDVRFDTEFVSRGCSNHYIVSHKQTINDMHSKYRLTKAKGVQCEREFQTRGSYEYNWEEMPSKCCDRRKGVL